MTQPNSPYSPQWGPVPQGQQGNQQPAHGTYGAYGTNGGYGTNTPQPQQFQNPQSMYTAPMNGPLPPQQERTIELSQPVYGISAPKAFVRFFKKYATFSGRASRSEYWWMMMWQVIFFFVVSMLTDLTDGPFSIFLNSIVGIVSLGILVPQIALTVRRYHDSGHSGYLYLASIIPHFLGVLLVVVGVIQIAFAAISSSGSYTNGAASSSISYLASGVHGAQNYDYQGNEFQHLFSGIDSATVSRGFILILVGILMSLAGAIVNLVFTIQASKVEGVRFDNPQLPPQYTVYPPTAIYVGGPSTGYNGPYNNGTPSMMPQPSQTPQPPTAYPNGFTDTPYTNEGPTPSSTGAPHPNMDATNQYGHGDTSSSNGSTSQPQ
ncbi:MAG: DUF805 domain-containing protein [Bifidobacteriaceae bacterium]|nr:DUF805 domain-containing protein [Bifidobacteriaceae bacterium]MCI1979730.1 DUF805 domain-containing protein [Bifidobacteriaceae bacterium]